MIAVHICLRASLAVKRHLWAFTASAMGRLQVTHFVRVKEHTAKWRRVLCSPSEGTPLARFLQGHWLPWIEVTPDPLWSTTQRSACDPCTSVVSRRNVFPLTFLRLSRELPSELFSYLQQRKRRELTFQISSMVQSSGQI